MSEPDDNPFLAPQSKDIARDVRPRGKPSVLATVVGVIVGLMIAAVVFCGTFFVTCLGLLSFTQQPGELGEISVFVISGLTAVAAFVFTVWGIRRISSSTRTR
jgi:drug/metabolite transporter (DMT)-like permease